MVFINHKWPEATHFLWQESMTSEFSRTSSDSSDSRTSVRLGRAVKARQGVVFFDPLKDGAVVK